MPALIVPNTFINRDESDIFVRSVIDRKMGIGCTSRNYTLTTLRVLNENLMRICFDYAMICPCKQEMPLLSPLSCSGLFVNIHKQVKIGHNFLAGAV